MSLFVDILSACSIVGIWPRFIEPRLLKTSTLTWPLPPSAPHLAGLKIVHLTDLHFHARTPDAFLQKIIRHVYRLSPDLIVFTGDFLCYSQLEQPDRLVAFLSQLKAPLGSFCTLGNHDYAQYASLNEEGIYDLLRPLGPLSGILRGLKTMFLPTTIGCGVSARAREVPLHAPLCALLEKTPFQLLENKTVTLPIGLNISGLGDIALGKCLPKTAFTSYNPNYPGIILSHNPDSFPSLLDFPGNWILAGHTHGEQIHFPWPKWGRKISQRLARLENRGYSRGLFSIGNEKWLYVNRGLWLHQPFRLFSPPEICCIVAKMDHEAP